MPMNLNIIQGESSATRGHTFNGYVKRLLFGAMHVRDHAVRDYEALNHQLLRCHGLLQMVCPLAVRLAVLLASAGICFGATEDGAGASRSLPTSYFPNSTNTVSISYSLGSGGIAATIVDTPPPSWNVVGVSSGGYYDASANVVRFGPLLAAQTGSVSYQVVSPAGQTGSVSFSNGLLSVDGSALPIGGQALLPPAPPNQPPLVGFATNVVRVLEDSVAFTLNAFATLSASEATQAVTSVTLSLDNPEFFSVQPTISLAGQLTFTLAPNAFGTNTITVVAADNGGSSLGGVDATTNTFVIEIQAVNDAPSFVINTNLFATPSLPAPALRYSFDGTGDDVSGNTNHAILRSGATFETANGATGLKLANPFGVGGSEIRAELPTNGSITALGASSFTVAIRYRTTDLNNGRLFGAQHHQIAMNYLMASPSSSLSDPNTRPAGSVSILGASLAENAWSAAPRTADGNWHWQIISVDRLLQTASFFVDGVLVGVANINSNAVNMAGAWIGGTPAYSGSGLIGTVDDFRIYTNALSSAQVALLLGQSDAPSTTLAASVGENQFGGFLASASSGPANESGQTVLFSLAVDRADLFSTLPTIGADGVLRFTPSKPGIARVSLFAIDSGGTDSGGKDRSSTNEFAILIQPGLLPPAISVDPVGATVDSLTNVTFSVRAQGALLRFQWQKDGTNLVGSTGPDLTLSAVTTNDNGSYRVLVSNSQGAVTSQPAVLVVSRRTQTLTFDPPEDRQMGSGIITLNGSASSRLPVVYASLAPGIVTITGETATPVGVGTTPIVASQPGNAAYFAATSVTQSFTVLAPPQPGFVHFVASSLSVGEAQGSATVVIRRAGGGHGAATVKCRVIGSTAEPGKDFQFVERTVAWQAGEIGDRALTISILNDSDQEADETIELQLTDATGAQLSTPSTMTIILVDDDNVPPKTTLVLGTGNLIAPATFTLVADSFDTDGVAKLEFFQDGTNKLGEFAGSTASLPIERESEGVRTYTVRATDRKGASASSEPLLVVISRRSTNDMSLHLPLDGNFRDASGNLRDGTNRNAVFSFVPGALEAAAQFDATTTNGIEVPVIQPGTESISFSVWVRTEATTLFHPGTPEVMPVLTLQSGDFANGARLFVTRQSGVLGAAFQVAHGTGSPVSALAPGALLSGQWHHLVGVLDRTSQSAVLYVDGILATSAPVGDIGALLPTNLWVGAYRLGTGEFMRHSGQVDDVRIFPRALDAADVRSLAASSPYVLLPVIVQPPRDVVQQQGGTGTLSVDVISRSPAAFQWTRNTSPIPGATNSSLVLSNLPVDLSGSYAVTVSNRVGFVTSPVARLTVMPPPPVGVIQLGASSISTPEAAGVLLIPVVRFAGAHGLASAVLTIEGGTGMTNRDYREFSATVAWAAGEEGAKNIAVPIIDNALVDGDRTLLLRLTAVGGASLGTNVTATAVINDDDFPPPSVALAITGTNFTAPATYSLSVSVSAPGGLSAIELFENSSKLGGASTNPATFLVAAKAPGTYDYRARALGSNGVPGESSPISVVVHGPRTPGSLQFAASRYSIGEASRSATLAVQRVGGGDGEITVAYSTTAGTAFPGTDFSATNGVLTWPEGDTQPRFISVSILNDTLVETNEQFTVQLSNPTGGATLGAEVSATVEIQDNDSAITATYATRSMPSIYLPGVLLPVSIIVSPPTNVTTYGIEEFPPAGWTVSGLSEGGSYDVVTRKVKFVFLDNQARTLTYQVLPPTGGLGVAEFAGSVAGAGVSLPISGQNTIQGNTNHPADLQLPFGNIGLLELISYADAWKRGESWQAEPTPINPSYLNRAILLYKNGETYRLGDLALGAPGWWIPSNSLAPASLGNGVARVSQRVEAATVATAITALGTRTLPASYTPNTPFQVQLTVAPPNNTGSYLMIERPPANWRVENISSNGVYNPSDASIRWTSIGITGTNTFTYTVTPPAGESGTKSFAGSTPWDDGSSIQDYPIAGATSLSPVVANSPRILVQPSPVVTPLGGTATFVADASGSAPLTYQWHRNGVPISGATNANLSLTNVSGSLPGLYAVLAANPYGSEFSRPASLSLTPFASLEVIVVGQGTVTPAGGDFAPGQQVLLSATSSNGWAFAGWQGALTGLQPTGSITVNGLTKVTAEFRDVQLPTILITKPASTGTNEIITLAGSVSDNHGIAEVWWERENGVPQFLSLSNGTFAVTNVVLSQTGTNVFRVVAKDISGNYSTSIVQHVWQPAFQMALSWKQDIVREGRDVTASVLLTSPGGVWSVTIYAVYPSKFFVRNPVLGVGANAPSLRTVGSSFTDVANPNGDTFNDRMLTLNLVFSGPVAAGTKEVATLTFRARTVDPEDVNFFSLNFEAPLGESPFKLFNAVGGLLQSGTGLGSEVGIFSRDIPGDINGLALINRPAGVDVEDAVLMLDLISTPGLLQERPWENQLNDLTGDNRLDLGDVIKALAIASRKLPQPSPFAPNPFPAAASARRSTARRAVATTPRKTASVLPDPVIASFAGGGLYLLPKWENGELAVTAWLTGNTNPVRGLSWQLAYSTNFLELASYIPGPVASGLNYVESNLSSDGFFLSAAGSDPSSTNNGPVATLRFKVAPGTPDHGYLPLAISGELSSGTQNQLQVLRGTALSMQIVNGIATRVPLRMLEARRAPGGLFSIVSDQGFSSFVEPLDPGRHGEVEVWVSDSLGRTNSWTRLPNPILTARPDGLLQVDAPVPQNVTNQFYQLRGP